MARLQAARSSLRKYTERANSMNSRSKAWASSLRRMASSMSHSRSLTASNCPRSAAMSTSAASFAAHVDSSSSSSRRTLASLAGSLMRRALISRMVSLSISSPCETGTWIRLMCLLLAGESGDGEPGTQGIDQGGARHLGLFAVLQVLDCDHAFGQLALAQHEHITDPGAVGVLELLGELAALQHHFGGNAGGAQLARQGEIGRQVGIIHVRDQGIHGAARIVQQARVA